MVQLFKQQTYKMVKYIQTIRGQQPTNCLSVFDHFVGLALQGLTNKQELRKLTQLFLVLTSFEALFIFCTSWKNKKTSWFSDVFRVCVTGNWLKWVKGARSEEVKELFTDYSQKSLIHKSWRFSSKAFSVIVKKSAGSC